MDAEEIKREEDEKEEGEDDVDKKEENKKSCTFVQDLCLPPPLQQRGFN